MTAKEKAAAIVRGYKLHMESDGPEIARTIENAITAAVEEEREACAKIADDAVEGYATFADIASDIRARGNKDR